MLLREARYRISSPERTAARSAVFEMDAQAPEALSSRPLSAWGRRRRTVGSVAPLVRSLRDSARRCAQRLRSAPVCVTRAPAGRRRTLVLYIARVALQFAQHSWRNGVALARSLIDAFDDAAARAFFDGFDKTLLFELAQVVVHALPGQPELCAKATGDVGLPSGSAPPSSTRSLAMALAHASLASSIPLD
ncbi:MAG: hypothetical protein ACI841_002020 [Planctomycetota bacterium]|jgi:hypothetical protein